MSITEDLKELARNGLRNLYLQIVDLYTESIKSGIELNPLLLEEFNLGSPPDYAKGLNKTEWAIQAFIDKNIDIGELADQFEAPEVTLQFLITQYDYYGINPPPEGFLQLDYDVKEWWKFRTRLQNGYFIYVEVFSYDGTNLKKGGNSFPFNLQSSEINNDLNNFLRDKTKDAYLEYANQNSFATIVSKEQMQDQYFFVLDKGKNSIKFVSDANGNTGKIYIRYFFNEFGQKLNSSIIEITGVEELKKVPGGIRKNYIVKNMISGIDAFKKYYSAEGPPEPRIQDVIEGLEEVKKLVLRSIQEQKISLNSRIGFVFTEEYEFLSCLDSENRLIDNYYLYDFLKDKTELNKYVARLNSINCQLVGNKPPPQTSPYGNTPNNYQHFVSNNESYKKETPEQKAINFQAERNSLKFIGDTALQIIFDQVKQLSPQGAAIAEIYRTFLNRVDMIELIDSYSKDMSKKIALPDLRKAYFKVFVESLDLTEIVDCIVENAGVPKVTKQITFPPALDEDGLPNDDVEAVVTSVQSSKSFELDLKTLLYGRFAYFYNLAKESDPETFNFPTPEPDDKLPNAGALVETINDASAALTQAKENFEQIKQELAALNEELAQEDTGDLEDPIFDQVIAKESEFEAAEAAVAQAEQTFLEAQSVLEMDQDKNFMYISMIPPSQTGAIYNTIVNNDPQYKYKSDLINNGMIQARDSALFTPETFISTLFKNEIIKYSNNLTEVEFQDFYDNIAEKNKKLKTSTEIEDDAESGLNSQEKIGQAAKTNSTSSPKPINFSFFEQRYPIISFEPLFSQLIQEAYDAAIRAALAPLTDAAKAALNNGFNGNEDDLDRLDPDIKAEYLSNDVIQNLLNANGLNGLGAPNLPFKSPLDVYLAVQKNVFPTNSIEDITCLFEKVYSEIPVQVQLKLLSGAVDSGSTSLVIVKDIFLDCVGNDSYSLIRDFFIWLRGNLELTGGINELLQKIEDAKAAALLNTDICDANSSVDDILAANDSREAIQSLTEVLSLLGDERRNALIPDLFSNSNGTNKKSVFDDHYSDPLKDSLNKQVKSEIEGINDTFNQEISKFKSIILKQNSTISDIIAQIFGSTLLEQQQTLDDFANGTAAKQSEFEAKQKNLQKIILEALKLNNLLSDDDVDVDYDQDEYVLYKITIVSYTYNIIITKQEVNFQGEDLEEDQVYIIVTTQSNGSVEVIKNIPLGDAPQEDLVTSYQNLVSQKSPLEFKSGANELLEKEYDDTTGMQSPPEPQDYLSQKIIGYLKFNEDYIKGNKKLLETIVSTMAEDFVLKSNLFENNNFSNIPLKDNEAEELGTPGNYNTNYKDGGLLVSDKIFNNYQDQRKIYQKFTNFGDSPDAHQISNLKSLYECLFNVLIMESLMRQFFTLGEGNLSLSSKDSVKTLVVNGVADTFKSSLTKIGKLSQDYTGDIDLLYKMAVLEEKLAAGPVEPDTDVLKWNYTQEQEADKIEFLALKYYDDLLDRLMTRISLSVVGFNEGTGVANSLDYILKNTSGGDLFDMYDQDQDTGDWPPKLTGLKKGLFLQKYVDIRQNGSLIKQKPGGSNLDDLYDYIPAYITFNDGQSPSTYYPKNNYTVGNIKSTDPVYTNFFFTEFTEQIVITDSSIYNKVTGYPNVTNLSEGEFSEFYNENGGPNQYTIDGDLDELRKYKSKSYNVPNGFASALESQDWKKKFVRTQGKINQEDFRRQYRFLGAIPTYENEMGPDINFIDDNTPTPLPENFDPYLALLNYGPEIYYNKLKVGVRLSLAIPIGTADQTIAEADLSGIITDYNDMIANFDNPALQELLGVDSDAREIAKEKIGIYKNETGDQFFVMPLMAKEEDILEIAKNEWGKNLFNLSTVGEVEPDSLWHNVIYDNLKQYNFESKKSELISEFTKSYPEAYYFAQLLPLTISEFIDDQYGDQISNIFNMTKQEIIQLIEISKAVINGEWDIDLDQFAGATDIPGVDNQGVNAEIAMYLPIVLSLIPVLIQYSATFADPTWKTPWFTPGPQTPLGFMAKILSITQNATE